LTENGRRARTVYTRNQVKELEKIFHINHYVDLESRKSLSKRIGLEEDRIQVIGEMTSLVLAKMTSENMVDIN
jgi:hypothetical protein